MARRKRVKEDALKASRMTKGVWPFCIILIIYATCLLIPYLIGLLSSFKSLSNYVDHMFGLTELTLENYKKVITGFVYPIIMKN